MRSLIAIATSLLIFVGVGLCQGTGSSASKVINVWPAAPPPWHAPQEAEVDTSESDSDKVAGEPLIRLGNVSKPELHLFYPEQGRGDTVVIICPGGGYSILAWDLEGTEIAQWLQGLGVTAAVLKYRVPTRDEDQKWLAPVQDIQRSVSLLRSGKVEGVTAKRIGVLGFSAGGNAAVRAATATKRYYTDVDESDQASATPDFAVLVYPAWLVKEDEPTKLIDEIRVSEKTPPMFFAHARDDRVTCMSSVTMFSELQRNGVASSLHIFTSGGHGFGARQSNTPDDQWPGLCETWMRNQGWLEP